MVSYSCLCLSALVATTTIGAQEFYSVNFGEPITLLA